MTILVLAFTGLRFGELAALKVKRVDFARRRLWVAQSMTEVGGRSEWSTPKTHEARSVSLPRSLVEPLRALCAGRDPDDPVFPAPNGGVLRLGNWRHRCSTRRARPLG